MEKPLYCLDCGCEIEDLHEGEQLCISCHCQRFEDMPGGF